MAPEILLGNAHNNSCDMWSIGIILFLIISGTFPFDLNNLDHEIKESAVLFPKGTWGDISQLCKDFILKLLDK
jgi:serine/threonine protein kinase